MYALQEGPRAQRTADLAEMARHLGIFSRSLSGAFTAGVRCSVIMSVCLQGKATEVSTNHAPPSQRRHTTATCTVTRSGDLRLPPIKRQSEHLKLPHRQPQHLNSKGVWPGGYTRYPLHDLSSPSYPRTTAREVGWRSVDIGRLERYGRHARGQKGIRKLLNWPREAIL